jgi:hypothetical protein
MQRPIRLQIKPFQPTSEHIDGAWWPRSRRLTDELPELVTSLSERLGPIAMVGYHHNGWDDPLPLLEIGGHTVELLGFSSDEPASMILIGRDGQHLTLHVIPPDASDQSGRQALDEAGNGTDVDILAASRSLVARSVADVADKLARHERQGDEQRTAQIKPQIKQCCEEVAQQFVDAPIQTFVPILVEHIVRNRMMESRAATTSAGPVLRR